MSCITSLVQKISHFKDFSGTKSHLNVKLHYVGFLACCVHIALNVTSDALALSELNSSDQQ